MKPYDIDKKLRAMGKESHTEVPDLIRKRQDAVYASLAELPMGTRANHHGQARFKRKLSFIVASIILFTVIGGIGGMMLSPAMADTLKSIPVVRDIFEFVENLGLRTASERGLTNQVNESITQEGITLHISQVVYDGNSVYVPIQREGEEFKGDILSHEIIGEGSNMTIRRERGSVEFWEMYINGVSAKDGYPLEQQLGLYGIPTANPNAMIFELNGYSPMGTSVFDSLDEFTLRTEVKLKGIEELYVFEFPVYKNTDKLSVPLNIVKKAEGLTLTVEAIEFTPITSKLIYTIEADNQSNDTVSLPMVELFEQDGTVLGELRSNGGIGPQQEGILRKEMGFDRMSQIGDYLTLQVSVPQFEDETKKTGLFKLDADGNIVKSYIKELELKIPLTNERSKIEKLYEN